MPKRSSKGSRDVNQIAKGIVDRLSGDTPADPPHEKNPAAVALGRLGGLKGGRARADQLSDRRRRQIARKAAAARWSKKKEQPPGSGG